MTDCPDTPSRLFPVSPPCDACFQEVLFDPRTRLFAHATPTSCTGIDGVILAVPRREWNSLRAPAPRAPQGQPIAGFDLVEMTSVDDRRTHTITPYQFDLGIWDGRGIYRAVCGHDVIVTALVDAPGPPCPDCPPRVDPADVARPHWTVARLRVAFATLPGLAGLRPSSNLPRSPGPGTAT